MRAIVDIPSGEPSEGHRILTLETEPQVGHHVGDQNGNVYEIIRVIHLIDTNKSEDYPYLKLIVRKDELVKTSTLGQ